MGKQSACPYILGGMGALILPIPPVPDAASHQDPLATPRGLSIASGLDGLCPLPILSQVISCSPDQLLQPNVGGKGDRARGGRGLREQPEYLNELILRTQGQVSL